MGGHHHHHGGHDHGHEHDTTLLTSKDTTNPGVRITRIGLYPPRPRVREQWLTVDL